MARSTPSGSSPRVRGAVGVDVRCDGSFGIIPACAGSSSRSGSGRTRRRDHPRVCGEQFSSASGPVSGLGSSPRVRGAADVCVRMLSPVGIIPARAGSRS